jgi:hypothetical protein
MEPRELECSFIVSERAQSVFRARWAELYLQCEDDGPAFLYFFFFLGPIGNAKRSSKRKKEGKLKTKKKLRSMRKSQGSN